MQDSEGSNWTLDGDTITVFIPMRWKRRGGRKVIIAPDGGDAWVPAKLRPDETLVRALARAHRWNRMLEAGRYRSITEIAAAEKIDRSFVSRLLDLTLLAPAIQEAILEGRPAKGMQLDELMGTVPSEWEEQPLRAGHSTTFVCASCSLTCIYARYTHAKFSWPSAGNRIVFRWNVFTQRWKLCTSLRPVAPKFLVPLHRGGDGLMLAA
jgi:hypothetical protein